MKEQYKRLKHPLNVLKYGYCGGIRNISHNIKQFFRNLKWAYQRVVWGFSEGDTWELDAYFLELFYQSLTYFSQHLEGYPWNFNEESWLKYLNKMIAHFYNAQEMHRDNWASIKEDEAFDALEEIRNNFNEPKEGYTQEDLEMARKKFFDATIEATKFREQEMHYAIDMLEEVFFSLW